MSQILDDRSDRNAKAKIKKQIKIEFAFCCAYCGSKPKQLTLDHLLAESKGGSDCWRNLVPACMKCNSSKGSKHLSDWYIAALPFYSQERLQRIVNRCGVKTWALLPRISKGFNSQL